MFTDRSKIQRQHTNKMFTIINSWKQNLVSVKYQTTRVRHRLFSPLGDFVVRLTINTSGGSSISTTKIITVTNTVHTVDMPVQVLCYGSCHAA